MIMSIIREEKKININGGTLFSIHHIDRIAYLLWKEHIFVEGGKYYQLTNIIAMSIFDSPEWCY